jgi:CheY-like chemotaxis protein
LESAILNLALNARDAMPGGGELTIMTGETIAGPEDGNLRVAEPVVFVTVSDAGKGMSPDVSARAFEPFFTTKEVGQGSGLGLSMVYGFAQQSGGHATIKSSEGEGTAVTLLLPAVNQGIARPAASSNSNSAEQQNEVRVLVVEDEPAVRQFVTTQLKALGYCVEAVATGPEAVKLLECDTDFELLLTDIVLPGGMSGVELAKRARQIKADLKVLLTSGYPKETFEHHGRPEADMPVLRKPYRRGELAEAVRRVLEQSTFRAKRARCPV